MNKIIFLWMISIVFVFELFAKDEIHFGVFNHMGYEKTKERYEPIVEYLNEILDKKVVLEILSQCEMDRKIDAKEIDIATTSPTHFLGLRSQKKLSGALATLISSQDGVNYTNKFGGVIVVRTDSDIKSLHDIEGKIIATSSTNSMGGYRAQIYELYKAGNRLSRNSNNVLSIESTHRNTIKALLDEMADVAFVRDGILEQMIENKELKREDIRVLNEQKNTNHPFIVSTALYPEWPIFTLPHANEADIRDFLTALFLLHPSSNYAKKAKIYGYSLAADYFEVEQLLRELRLPPFNEHVDITPDDVWKKYKYNIILFIMALLIALLYYIKAQRKKRFIESLLTNMGEGVYGVDEEGKCIWINQKALDILGFSKKEILGKNPHNLFHHHTVLDKIYEEKDCSIYQTIEDRVSRESTEYFIKKDSSFFPVNLSVAPNNDGGVIVVFRDITELKKAQDELVQERDLFSSGPVITVKWEPSEDWPMTYISKNAYDILGYTQKEMISRAFLYSDIIHPDDIDRVFKEVYNNIKNHIDYFEQSYRLKIKDGSYRWFYDFTKLVRDEQGHFIAIHGYLFDQTNLKESEIKLEKSKALFKTIFDTFPDSAIILDSKTHLPFMFNYAAHTQLGYDKEQFKELEVSDYEGIESKEDVKNRIDKIYAHGKGEFKTKHRKKDGTLIDIFASTQFIELDNKPYLFVVSRDISEIEKYRRELERQKRDLSYIIDGASVGTWEWHIDSGKTVFNEKWAQIVGYSLQELEPTTMDTWIRLSHPQDLSKSQEMLDKHFRGECDYYECEVRMKHKDGYWVWVLDRGKISQVNEDGKPIVMFGTHQDVTKTKEAQIALQQSESKYDVFFNSMDEMIFIKNEQLEYILTNTSLEKFFGKTKEEFYKKTDFDFMSKESATLCQISDIEVFKEQKRVVSEEVIADRILQTHKFPLKLSDNEVGLGCYIVDITTQKLHKEELRRSKKLHELFFRQSLYGFFFMMIDEPVEWNESVDKESVLDYVFTHQRITKINEAMLQQYGAKEEELIGLTPSDFYAHNIEYGKSVWREFFDKGHLHIDTNEKKFGGNDITISGDYICIYDEQNRILGHFGVQQDVTEDRKTKEALVNEKIKAEDANRTKSQFLANMSHEIRTPMNAIIGLSELMLDTKLDEKQKDITLKVNGSSKILLGIINDILDYSKIEAGKLELEYNSFNIDSVMEQLKFMFLELAIKKSLKPYCEIQSDVPKIIVGDELRVTQVLANLISNAMKFTHSGSIGLNISLKRMIDDKRAIINFSVEDTGIGMSNEQLKKLFTPFTQADNSTTRKYGGTGLGLSISKKIVEAMGSQLHVESKKNIGSRFYFDLEVEVVSHNAIDTHNAIEKKRFDFKGVHVLLVEDNSLNQEVASMILSRVGIEVDIANNGKEGVDKYLSNPFKYKLILMDLQMPFMSGYEATRLIREHDKKIPIIALSAAAMVEDRQKALESGMNEHLGKPIDMQKLYTLIQKYCCNIFYDDKGQENKKNLDAILDIDFLAKNIGSQEAVEKLLRKFIFELTHEFKDIVHIVQSNMPDTQQKIHTLKGLSGNLGANALYAQCAIIDKKYKENEEISSQDIKNFQDAFEDVKRALEELDMQELKESEAVILEEKPFRELYSSVRNELLSSGVLSPKSKDEFIENLKSRINHNEVTSWEEAISDFEYDKAIKIMDGWKIRI